MLELLDFDRLEEILVLIIPGFVSLKVWTLINPTARLKLADYLLDIIAFSTLNFVALSSLPLDPGRPRPRSKTRHPLPVTRSPMRVTINA